MEVQPTHPCKAMSEPVLQRASHAAGDFDANLLVQAFKQAPQALLIVDDAWHIRQMNAAALALLRDGEEELLGNCLALRLLPPPAALGSLRQIEALRLALAGGERPVGITVVALAGPTPLFLLTLTDSRERIAAEARFEQLANSDPLTGLPNRVRLQNRLVDVLAAADKAPFGLLFLDLDGFKAVNDNFGHGQGDQTLLEVAERLQSSLPHAFIGRWGSDEFVAILPPGSGDTEVREAAQTLLATMTLPFPVGSKDEVRVSPSIGAVLAPRDGSDAGRLVQKAEAAMYFAKDQGKNRLCLFEPEIERQSARRVRMQGLLRVAAECNGFSFVAQSKVDANGLTVGAELLMRWSCAEFGVVSPAEFIPIAEQTGAIELMGRQALMQAAKLVAQANRRRAGVSIAVNVSPRQLQNGGLERLALRACALHGIEPGQLELELTESALATGLDAVTPLLQRLRAQGFVLSLDDFGTGYSSLSHLLHLPFHKVKIDRAFVRYLLEDERAREVVKGTLMICRGLGLTTVAEGVETSHQFVMLRELGVDEFQGYFFARPIPTEAWLDTLGHSEV